MTKLTGLPLLHYANYELIAHDWLNYQNNCYTEHSCTDNDLIISCTPYEPLLNENIDTPIVHN